MSSHMMQVAALGQSFELGMLYDARNQRLISGLSLWDSQMVKDNMVESFQHSSAFDMSASNSTESKTSLLDVDASLKVSFLAGLVEVSGSAKYLNDQKKFQNQSRVTFHYNATSTFRELTVTHLSLDPSIIQEGTATHVVTGILYGANAFFVFDSQKLESCQVQEVHGSMQAVIKKIPSFNVEGQADIKLTDQEKSLVQTFSCTFHGDFILESNPTTFEAAVKTYVELPKLLGDNGEHTVPVKVWLLPLIHLVPEAPKLMRDLSGGLVRRVEEGLEDLEQMEIRCNDSLVDGVGEDFPQIQGDLQRFQKLCRYYRSDLQQTMKMKLPSIREGHEDESSLKQVFDDRNTSPFSHHKLVAWLQNKERQINVIRSCVEIMEGVKIVHNQSELDREVLSPGVQQVLCFAFTSLESTDPCLDEMQQYLDSHPSLRPNHEPWYYSDQVLTQIREKARTFTSLYNAKKLKKKIRFLIAAIQNDKHSGVTICHYKDGVLVTDDFSLPDVEKITKREDLLFYGFSPTVDMETVNNHLTVTEGNMKVTNKEEQSYPQNPRRFQLSQFMCQEVLTGRHYWEVEWSNTSVEIVIVGVAYEKIQRHDKESGLGFSVDSYGLGHFLSRPLSISSKIVPLHDWVHCGPVVTRDLTRLGVFLDWHAGTLSFYCVSSNLLTHLYTFHTSFTDPLYPACFVGCQNNYVDMRLSE